MAGWIKLHRMIQQSPSYIFLNSKQRDVMIQCLLLANHKPNEWFWGKELCKCEPGQFISSLENIKRLCGKDVKVQSVRTALLKLEKVGFLTNISTKTGRLITIVNWHVYQSEAETSNKDTNKELTKSQQRPNKELTTNKNDKNVNNENNEKKEEEIPENKFSKFQDVIDLYHKVCVSCKKVRKISDDRKRHMRVRMKDNTKDEFNECFRNAEKSMFLKESGFFDLWWLMKSQENFLKVLEGKYDKGISSNGGNGKPVQMSVREQVQCGDDERYVPKNSPKYIRGTNG